MPTVLIPAGDLALVNGTLAFCDGAVFYRQKLASRFQFFKGEWFLDQRQGIPYFRDVFVKNPDLDLIRSLFRRVILTTPGIGGLKRFSLAYDMSKRTLTFEFEATTIGGSPIVVKPTDQDFLVDVSQ